MTIRRKFVWINIPIPDVVEKFLRLAISLDLSQRLLMSKSTIEPNGLHYPDVLEHPCNGIVPVILESSPCYFAGCVPNEPCKVERWERYHNQPSEVIQEGDDRGNFEADRYEPTNLDDLVY